MKKGKFIILGLIALVMAVGLVLASCGARCGPCGYLVQNCARNCDQIYCYPCVK